MKKNQILFIVTASLLILASLFLKVQAQTDGIQWKSTLTTEQSMIKLKMDNLIMANDYWTSEQDGWYHETKTSQPGGPSGFHFSNQDHWFEIRDGKVINDLLIISDADQGDEVQRWIIADGMRAELTGLKRDSDVYDYMKPTPVGTLITAMFPQVAADLEEIKLREPFIDSMLMTETREEGASRIHVRVVHSHHGMPNMSAHGLPPGRNVGMVSRYTYDAATGNRMEYSFAYLNHDLTTEAAHVSVEETVFVGELPAEIQLVWEESLAALEKFIVEYAE